MILCDIFSYLHRSDHEISMIRNPMLESIQRLIDQKAYLSAPARQLAANADLYRFGLTPFTAIQLMVALEKEFNIEFPKQMLNRHSMSSINAIRSRIRLVQEQQTLLKAA